jgi:integrase
VAIEKLSASAIRDAKPGRHGDGGGLWLEVDRSGAKRWVLRYMLRGNAREMGLGNLATVSAAKAREAARAARELLRDRIDPIDRRKEEHAARDRAAMAVLTFRECADRYFASHSAAWGVEHARQWKQKMRDYITPKLGTIPVRLIDTDAVLRALEPIWITKTRSAAKVRGQIENVLSWATAGGYRKTDDGMDLPNPASWELLQHLLPSPTDLKTVVHLDAMDYRRLPEFVTKLRQHDSVLAMALEFTILCATRSDETLDASRSEIDFQRRIWTIPGSHTKNGNEHVVPLSDRAMEIVKKLPTDEKGYLFPGNASTGRFGKNAMYRFLRDRLREETTVHGFRASFRTWAAECTDYAHELLEIALNHEQPSSIVEAYQRGPMIAKRRECVNAWVKFVSTPYVGAEIHEFRKSA